jgi:hypothetical protein
MDPAGWRKAHVLLGSDENGPIYRGMPFRVSVDVSLSSALQAINNSTTPSE